MARDLLTYLQDNPRQYKMRLKTTVPLDDERMAALEKALQKYDVKDIDGPTKTIMHQKPVDFMDIDAAEVFIVDMTLGMPISSHVLFHELNLVLKIPQRYMVVKGENDPSELESERITVTDEIAKEAKLAGMSIEAYVQEHPEKYSIGAQPLFGNEYNEKLLQYLSYVAATRRPVEVTVPYPLFSFIDLPSSEHPTPIEPGDFNDSHSDVPRPYPWWMADNLDTPDKLQMHLSGLGRWGQVNDDPKRFYGRHVDPKTGVYTSMKDETVQKKPATKKVKKG